MIGPLISFFKNIVILLVSDVYEQNQLNIISSLATVAKLFKLFLDIVG
jgi:hypothetical protein